MQGEGARVVLSPCISTTQRNPQRINEDTTMAHEIERNEMFSVRATPWHRQGTVLDRPPSTREALRAAGLDWCVHKVPLVLKPVITRQPVNPFDDDRSALVNIDTLRESGHYATVRYHDGEPVILGAVTERYAVLQNRDAFKVFDEVLLPEGYSYETAGAIKGGKRVWILARAPEGLTVGDDAIDKYALLVTSHDGSMNVRFMPTAIRVVCNNTMTWALRQGEGEGFSIRHTGNVEDKLTSVTEALSWANGSWGDARDVWQRMVDFRMEPLDATRFFEKVIPELKRRHDGSKAWIKAFGELGECFMYGRGNRGETLWHAYNAITEYLDHKKNIADHRAVDYTFFGGGGKIKHRAMDVARELIADKVVFPMTGTYATSN